MPDKILQADIGPDSPFSVGAGKQKRLLKFNGPGILIAIYYTTTQRDTELQIITDGKQVEMPTLTKLNSMNLNQTATLNQVGMKIHEYYSTSPYGFAFEHPVGFDSTLELVINNEAAATASIGHYIALWEKVIS